MLIMIIKNSYKLSYYRSHVTHL